MCWFGDGAASEGGAHEAMNLAGVHKLPVVFLCENNGYAISVPLALQMPITSMAERAAGYGICRERRSTAATREAVFAASAAAIARARAGEGPTLLELSVPAHHRRTPRRTTTRTAMPQRRRPLRPLTRSRALRTRLIELGALDAEEDEVARKTIAAEVLAASEEALRQAEPDGARARRWLYADRYTDDAAWLSSA